MQNSFHDIWFKRVALGIIAIGILLAIFNFFNFRSLWLDEVFLSVSIVNRDFAALLTPLEYDQVAPIGFLFVENAFGLLFNNEDWSLRIFPLLCFIASIALLYKLNLYLFKNTKVALLSAGLFALNWYLMYYSIEVKQYMSDVFIGLLIMVGFLYHLNNPSKKALWVFTLISMLSIWFSNIAVIILFVVGAYIFYKSVLKKNRERFISYIPLVGGLLSFVLYYTLLIHNHPAKAAMTVYWNEHLGFLYPDVLSWEFRYFLRSRLQSIVMLLVELGSFWWITLLFMVFGLMMQIKRVLVLSLLVMPFIVHLMLSYFKIYPFHLRLILYLFPLFITLLAVGWVNVYQLLKDNRMGLPIYILLLPIVVNLAVVVKKLPLENEEIKKSMAFMNTHIGPKDQIYVYRFSEAPFNFYKEKYSKIANNQAIVYGKTDIKTPTSDKEQLTHLENTVWLVFSHVMYLNNGSTEKDEILQRLTDLGYKMSLEASYEGSFIYKMAR